MKKHGALIFDLFGTLVYPVSQKEHRRMLKEMALTLAISPDDFIHHWTETADARMKGTFRNFRENIEYIYQQIGAIIDQTRISLATRIRLAMVQNEVVPRADAVEVLSKLKSEGYKTGLISDCSHEATKVWDNTPFPTFFYTTMFSCMVGITKPNPRIYQLALRQLNIEPRNCIYIGDGGSRELTGASQAGMQAVLLQIPNEVKADMYKIDSEDWDGIVITSLSHVLNLLK